jgi:hypothetical protein
MAKEGWGRDKGIVPGHPHKHPALHQAGQHHTPFESRGFHADRGSNTNPERMHTNFANRNKHNPDRSPTNVHGGHDPRPEHYHKNSGTTGDGHRLIRRGTSKMPVG